MELRKINMDRIILPKSRITYDDGEVFLLAKSIALAGLLSPISVVALSHSDRFEIVSGNKRFYACRLLGFKEISALIIKADTYFARTVLKKGNYRDFFAEADLVKETLIKTHLTAEELGNLTSYTPKEILSCVKLSGMSELEREIVRNNAISREIAYEIALHDDIRKRNFLLSETAKKRLRLSEVLKLTEKEHKSFAKKNARRTIKFKDLRLFDNTVSRAVEILKEAGVDAQLDTERVAGSTEYKIKIHS
ncbi:MAG: ParB N-terminal domain-containing protein [Clostridia bacterium]|nr:ParB N-terminal domain-containing protein [Clostridia bacterium]